jgi:hypothetical protein
MITRLPAALAISAVVVAGCAYVPRVNVAERTERPVLQPGPTYALSVQSERLPTQAGGSEALRQALSRHGWRETGDATAWTVRATYAVRPEHVGALGADQEAWLIQPRQTPWWRRPRVLHTLTLSLIPPGGQRESYRVDASISGPIDPPEETVRALASAAAERLDPARIQSPADISARGRVTTKQAPASPPL